MSKAAMPGNPRNKERRPDGEMPLAEHLRELRNRLLTCLAVLLACSLAGLYFAPDIVELLLGIGRSYRYRFVYIAPQELLLQYVTIALVFGLCAALPMVFYQTWAFVQPGLRRQEKALCLFAMVFGLGCFCGGVYFAYRVMLPFMLRFLISLSAGSSAAASISVQSYIAFLTTVFLVFGAVFELPVVSVILNRLGLLKARWMRKGRRVMIVVIFFAAAVITPPDVVSQVMVAVPMLALYELSILLCAASQKLTDLAARKKEKSE